jgi:hypothetical protein
MLKDNINLSDDIKVGSTCSSTPEEDQHLLYITGHPKLPSAGFPHE